MGWRNRFYHLLYTTTHTIQCFVHSAALAVDALSVVGSPDDGLAGEFCLPSPPEKNQTKNAAARPITATQVLAKLEATRGVSTMVGRKEALVSSRGTDRPRGCFRFRSGEWAERFRGRFPPHLQFIARGGIVQGQYVPAHSQFYPLTTPSVVVYTLPPIIYLHPSDGSKEISRSRQAGHRPRRRAHERDPEE